MNVADIAGCGMRTICLDPVEPVSAILIQLGTVIGAEPHGR